MAAKDFIKIKYFLKGNVTDKTPITIDEAAQAVEDYVMQYPCQIDNVTIERLRFALMISGIYIDRDQIDKIITLVELISKKGKDVTMGDVEACKKEWEEEEIEDMKDRSRSIDSTSNLRDGKDLNIYAYPVEGQLHSANWSPDRELLLDFCKWLENNHFPLFQMESFLDGYLKDKHNEKSK